jgi:hypothetical protein
MDAPSFTSPRAFHPVQQTAAPANTGMQPVQKALAPAVTGMDSPRDGFAPPKGHTC